MSEHLLGLDVATYIPSELHRNDRDWAENNCYIDVWIEILHALGYDPLAALGVALRVDLEADQWTFYKFSHDELFSLFGIDVIEMNPWSGVLSQTVQEVAAGRIVLAEVDAWFLPDTKGSSYRTARVKTSVGITNIDPVARTMKYFHNQGFHELSGEDFNGVFRLDPSLRGPADLPPYIEVCKPNVGPVLTGRALLDASLALLGNNVRRAPQTNPFVRFSERFEGDLDRLLAGEVSFFHDYSFAYFRQFGSAFALASAHLAWLQANGAGQFDPAIEAFAQISSTAKTLQFKCARVAMVKKNFDSKPLLSSLTESWESAFDHLRSVTT